MAEGTATAGATTKNAVLVAAIKIRRILDELDEATQMRVLSVLNAMGTDELLEYPEKPEGQLELRG